MMKMDGITKFALGSHGRIVDFLLSPRIVK